MTSEPLHQSEQEPKTQIEPLLGANPAIEPLRTPLTPARLSRAELRLKGQQTVFRRIVAVGWAIVAVIYFALYFYAHQTH